MLATNHNFSVSDSAFFLFCALDFNSISHDSRIGMIHTVDISSKNFRHGELLSRQTNSKKSTVNNSAITVSRQNLIQLTLIRNGLNSPPSNFVILKLNNANKYFTAQILPCKYSILKCILTINSCFFQKSIAYV